jgi:hypothetical protein
MPCILLFWFKLVNTCARKVSHHELRRVWINFIVKSGHEYRIFILSLRFYDKSIFFTVHLLPTLRQPWTSITQFAFRTALTVSDSLIFFTRSEMFEYDVHCTAIVRSSPIASMSMNPNRSLRMFAPGTHFSTTCARYPSLRKRSRDNSVGLFDIFAMLACFLIVQDVCADCS